MKTKENATQTLYSEESGKTCSGFRNFSEEEELRSGLPEWRITSGDATEKKGKLHLSLGDSFVGEFCGIERIENFERPIGIFLLPDGIYGMTLNFDLETKLSKLFSADHQVDKAIGAKGYLLNTVPVKITFAGTKDVGQMSPMKVYRVIRGKIA